MSWTFQSYILVKGKCFFSSQRLPASYSIFAGGEGGGGGHLGHESDQLPHSDAMSYSEWISSLPLMCVHAAHKERVLLAHI